MKDNLDRARFDEKGKNETVKSLSNQFAGLQRSPPKKYGQKLKKRPYVAPQGNWILNSGLCPSQAEAAKRERLSVRNCSEQ